MDYKQTPFRVWRKLRAILFSLCIITAIVTVLACVRVDLMSLFQPFNFAVSTTVNETVSVLEVSVASSPPGDYVLNTEGCKINKKDPWDINYKRHFQRLLPVSCPTEPNDILIYVHNNMVKVDSKAKHLLLDNGNQTAKFTCRLQSVYRLPIEENDNIFRVSKEYTEFSEETPAISEYMLVKCYVNNKTIYENYFYNVMKKPEVEKQCEANEKKFHEKYPDCDDHPSVLVLGVDSVSKLNFARLFPQTRSLLHHYMDAIEFFGYNKVGLNTFPCLVPYLTGMSVADLRKSCWSTNSMDHFDNCTFLWDSFADAGYRTAFVENLNAYGLFTYNRGGFKHQPVHYYGRTLYLAVEKHLKSYSSTGCWRGLSDDEALVHWAYEYQKQFANTSHYGHFWISKFSHNDLNLAQHADAIVARYLTRLKNEELLNNTVLIFMSDHGLRFGGFRETPMGRFEENIPFLYIVLPEMFKSKYPWAVRRLQRNSHRLITTFDLHETLKSLMNCRYKHKSNQEDDKVTSQRRGISLFDTISPQRTCVDADIPTIYCACNLNEQELDKTSHLARQIATTFLFALNNITSSSRNVCVEYTIKQIMSVKRVIHAATEDYVIALETTPGDAKFEGTFTPDGKQTGSGDYERYIPNADIRRINMYGETSHCISNDGSLKQTCYCKDQHS